MTDAALPRPVVLFVCVHNAGRSQMAAGWLQHLVGERIEVRSAGSEPTERVNPVAIEAMREVGIDITANQPKILTDQDVQDSDVVITMGCGDRCPFYPGRHYEDWDLDDPAGHSLAEVRPIRDEIRRRVEQLIGQLDAIPAAKTAVRQMVAADWPAVRRIYAAGIAIGHATFETEPPSWEQFDRDKLTDQRLVALDGEGSVIGWAAAAPVSDRCVYAGVVEHSVYVDPDAHGAGIGLTLLEALVASTEAAGIWTIQSGIFPENEASLALHRKAGFNVIGTRRRVGRMTYGPMADRWRDVLAVERRSDVVGR